MAGIELNTTILKETRESQGHTQESLARATRLARESYCRLENSGRTRKRTAEKLAEVLQVSVDYLTGADRGQLLYSPFSCEWTDPRATSEVLPKRRLFNTELELLEFLECQIEDERPHPIESGGDLAFPTFPLPSYSVSENGQDCLLAIPLHESASSYSEPAFLNFTFRELQHQDETGFIWRPLTKWAQLTIEGELRSALDKHYPEYTFNGEHLGENANFIVTLQSFENHESSQELRLENIPVARRFANWLWHHLPQSTAFLVPTDNAIVVHLFSDGSIPLDARLGIFRAHEETGTGAPFPNEWMDAILFALRMNDTPKPTSSLRIGKIENTTLPNLDDFLVLNTGYELIPKPHI
jgi:transcriptional regulator with XRE-family HTH domain